MLHGCCLTWSEPETLLLLGYSFFPFEERAADFISRFYAISDPKKRAEMHRFTETAFPLHAIGGIVVTEVEIPERSAFGKIFCQTFYGNDARRTNIGLHAHPLNPPTLWYQTRMVVAAGKRGIIPFCEQTTGEIPRRPCYLPERPPLNKEPLSVHKMPVREPRRLTRE